MDTKNSTLFIALRLTSICFVAVLLLGIINLVTAPRIKKNKEKTENDAMKILMLEGKIFNKKFFSNISSELKNTFYYYEVYDDNSNLLGYIASTEGKGYGGDIKVMVAFDKELKILNAKLLDNAETPGLGKKAESSSYMKKFIGTNTRGTPFPTNKNMLSSTEKDSITGATITFNGIVNAISAGIKYLQEEEMPDN